MSSSSILSNCYRLLFERGYWSSWIFGISHVFFCFFFQGCFLCFQCQNGTINVEDLSKALDQLLDLYSLWGVLLLGITEQITKTSDKKPIVAVAKACLNTGCFRGNIRRQQMDVF